jgi:hypothetical protein
LSRNTHILKKTNNIAARKTQTQVKTIRIYNEIKFLYRKKKQLNNELYKTHIKAANTWKQTWNTIEQSINQKLQNEMKGIYKNQQKMIHNLTKMQTKDITQEYKN